MNGMRRSVQLIRSRYRRRRSAASGIIPKAKSTTPASVAASGRAILGNWTCLISCAWTTTDEIDSVRPSVNHFQGRIAEKMKSG